MIPEEEVLIASKMAHSIYTLDPYDFVSKGFIGGIWCHGIQRIRSKLLPAGETKRFSTTTIKPEVEVGIATKMAYSTYALDPYELVRKG